MRGGSVFKPAVFTFGLAALAIAAPAFALDPTQPPAGRSISDTQQETTESLQLQAIVRVPGRARAVINGHTLRVGDRFGDAQVVAIRRHSVVVDRHGQHEELRLSAPIIQTSRTQP